MQQIVKDGGRDELIRRADLLPGAEEQTDYLTGKRFAPRGMSAVYNPSPDGWTIREILIFGRIDGTTRLERDGYACWLFTPGLPAPTDVPDWAMRWAQASTHYSRA